MTVEALKPPESESGSGSEADGETHEVADEELSPDEGSDSFGDEDDEESCPPASILDEPILINNPTKVEDAARPNKKRRRS